MSEQTELDPKDFMLPEYVHVCGVCNGLGSYRQHYLEGMFYGPCSWCRPKNRDGGDGVGFIVFDEPASSSVINQILVANKATRTNKYDGWHYHSESDQ